MKITSSLLDIRDSRNMEKVLRKIIEDRPSASIPLWDEDAAEPNILMEEVPFWKKCHCEAGKLHKYIVSTYVVHM